MFSTQKVGGLRFIRIGQFSMSYCITRKHPPLFTMDAEDFVSFGIIATLAASLLSI